MNQKLSGFFLRNKSCSCTMSGKYGGRGLLPGMCSDFHSPMRCVHVETPVQDRITGFPLMEDAKIWACTSCSQIYTTKEDGMLANRFDFNKVFRMLAKHIVECLLLRLLCVGVIGDAESEQRRKWKFPVICIPYAGFLGSEWVLQGGNYRQIIFKPCEHVHNRILLLGDQMGPIGSMWRDKTPSFFVQLGAVAVSSYLPFPNGRMFLLQKLTIVLKQWLSDHWIKWRIY